MARAERSLRARSRHIERPIIRARTRARRERLACSIGNAGNSGAHGDCSCFSVPNFSVPKFKSDRRHLDQPPDRSGAWAIKLDPEGLMEPCAPAWYYPQAAWCYPRPPGTPGRQAAKPENEAAERGRRSRGVCEPLNCKCDNWVPRTRYGSAPGQSRNRLWRGRDCRKCRDDRLD
jgi:hypothetical protein